MFLGILKKGDRKKRIIAKDGDIVVTPDKKRKYKQDKRNGKFRGKDGYKKYLNTKWWSKRKEQFYKNHEKICFCCSEKSSNLHHINYSRLLKEKDSDLVPLCKACHENVHYLIKIGKAKLKDAHIILKNLA